MSVLKTFDIALDTKKALYGSRITLVESDTGNRFVITLTDDGTAVDLTGCRVSVVFSGAMGTAMQESWTGTGDVSISGTSNNIITIDVHSGSFATGLNTCEIQVYSGATYTTLITSARFTFNAQKPILDDETIVSTDSYPTLVYWADKLEALTEREQADWTEADNTKGTYIQNKPVAGTGFQDATQNLIEETSILTTDIAPMYRPTGTAHHFKATVASWIVAIRTAIFGTTSGMLKANGSGVISAAVANTDYAAAAHASRHLIGGADALNAMPYDATSTSLLINGGFDVWQRGTSLSAGAGGFLADRWNDAAVTATIAPSQQAFTVGQTDVTGEPQFYHRAVVVAGNNAASFARTQQRIEDVRKLAGRTVTISFWVKADASKYIAIEFLQNFGNGGSPSAFVSGIGADKIPVTTSWQKITRTVVIPSIIGKTLGTTPNTSYTQFAIWYDAGADSAARASSIGYQSGTFDIANAQLNYGLVELPLVPRSFDDELRLCQRYYRPLAVNTLAAIYFTGYVRISSTSFSVMRVAPTATVGTVSFVGNDGTPGTLFDAGVSNGVISPIYNWTGGTVGKTFATSMSLSLDSEL